MLKVGITGGIGSGKSTLSRMFTELGVSIYDSDSRAKALMSSDKELRDGIVAAFGAQSYIGSELNRAYLAERVFNDSESLKQLNSIVHPRVKADFAMWCESQESEYVILECAILFEAGFNECVDLTLCVLSPKQMRIERVMSRDGLTAKQVESRIAHQMPDGELYTLSDFSVVNFEIADLEDAAKQFDRRFRHEASKDRH